MMARCEPILEKRPPRPDENKEMTWQMFLQLRQTAQGVANEIGFPVYLVGSALQKVVPRDIDVSVIMPLAEYENRYGKLPKDPFYIPNIMRKAYIANIKYYFQLHDAIGNKAYLDFKVCPDTWFVDKPKLLLAEPNMQFRGCEYGTAQKFN